MDERALIADLATLVAVPSGNPPCENDRIAGVAADLFRRRTQGEVRLQRVAPGRTNVLVRFGKPDRLWNAHLDTVPAGAGWTRRPLKLVREGHRLYGLGACDTKGAVAALLAAIASVAPGASRNPLNLLVLLTCDEEAGPGSCVPAFLEHPWRRGIRWGVVAEPTGGRVVIAHRAIYTIRVEFSGRTAHASRPERGRNAIDAAGRFLADLDGYRRMLSRRRDRFFHGSVLNVGTIAGGIKANMVADRCELKIGRRTLPGESAAKVSGEIRRIAERAARRFGCRAAVACTFAGPGLAVPPGSAPVRSLVRAGAGAPTAVDFWSEASLFTGAGIPSVVYGPGSIAQAHAPDEFVAVTALKRAWSVYQRLLC